ncbi:MAG: MFS transporter [Rhodospirillales bacterium]|nr:MFS transporter [Rhodospirillales bacterium]
MRAIALSLFGLFCGVFLLMAGAGVVGSAIPVRLGAADAASHVIGAVSAAYFMGLVIGTLFGNRLIASVGHIRAFATFASFLSAAMLMHPLFPWAASWAALRVVQGVCLAGLFMCTESWLNQQATDAVRGRLLSLYMVVLYLGQGLGQILLPIHDPSGFGLFVVASVLVSLAIVPVAAARIAGPKRPRPARISIVRLFNGSPIAAVGALASGCMLGAFYGLVPLFTQQVGLSLPEIAQFMGFAIVGGIVMQWPIGYVSDRVDRRVVIAAISALIAAVSGAVIVTHDGGALDLRLLAPLLGGTLFSLYPVCAAQANDRIEPRQRLGVSGGLIVTYGVGAALGPLAASAAMEATGPQGLFYAIAAVAVLTALMAMVRKASRSPCPVEDKVPFQVLPRTTPNVGTLNPHLDAAP